MSKHKDSGFCYLTPKNAHKDKIDTVRGASPLTVYNALPQPAKTVVLYGTEDGIGDYDSETGLYTIPVTVYGINRFDADKFKSCIKNLPTYSETSIDGKECACITTSRLYDKWTDTIFNRFFCDSVKPNTAYTLMLNIKNLSEVSTSLYVGLVYSDDSRKVINKSISPGIWEKFLITSNPAKTVKSICFSYGNNVTIAFDCKGLALYEGIHTEASFTNIEPYSGSTVYNVIVNTPLYSDEYIKLRPLRRQAAVYNSAAFKYDASALQEWTNPITFIYGTNIISLPYASDISVKYSVSIT